MSLVINLTPAEEAQLPAAVRQNGLAPAELAENLVREHLPLTDPMEEMHRRLREWQAQDGTKIMPEIPDAALFAQWAEEDAKMTNEEREAEDRLWEDFQKGINETRSALGMRLP